MLQTLRNSDPGQPVTSASSPTPTSLVVVGALGRMGRRIATLALEDGRFELIAGVDRPPPAGHDISPWGGPDGPPLYGLEGVGAAEVWIDFSTAAALESVCVAAAAAGAALVTGTTGFSAAGARALDEAARHIAVLQAPNMSVGVNLLFALAEQAARRLQSGWDAEIVETHHNLKIDAPSGTAKGLLQAVHRGRSEELEVVYGREGQPGARPEGEVGVHALRGGDVVGEHRLSFFGAGEKIELSHQATDRDIFARGALRAARWLAGRPAGRYTMATMLGLD